MSRSSGRKLERTADDTARDRPGVGLDPRASTQPLAALVAVLTVSVALSWYAVGLEGTIANSTGADRGIAKPTLDRVTEAVRAGGVVEPENLSAGLEAGPDGYELNVTVSAGDRRWHAGPAAPETAESASRAVGVRTAPGEVDPGRIRVEVWT